MNFNKELGGIRVFICLLILIISLFAIIFIVGVRTVSSKNTDTAISDTSIEADIGQLINDIKVEIDGDLVSYKDLEDVEVGTYNCIVYYENDIVTSKSAYIVNSFDDSQKEVTYIDGDFIKIILPDRK